MPDSCPRRPRGLPGQAAGLPSNSSGAPVLQQHRCPADL